MTYRSWRRVYSFIANPVLKKLDEHSVHLYVLGRKSTFMRLVCKITLNVLFLVGLTHFDNRELNYSCAHNPQKGPQLGQALYHTTERAIC